MRSRFLVTAIAVFGFLAGAVCPTIGTAQVLRRPRTQPPVVNPAPPPTTPLPAAAVPAQPPDQPAAPSPAPIAGERQFGQSQVPGQLAPAEAEGHGRIIHGSQLIGLRVWGQDNQQLGTIKDFIVDYQGDCPTLYFAMTPEVSDLGEGYVVVPFTAMRYDFDTRARANYFRFNVSLAQLRNAPRIEVNKWSSISNREFLANAQQFYQRIERTAARPESGGRIESGTRHEPGAQEPGIRPETGTRPAPGTRPDTGSRPDAGRTPDDRSRSDTGGRPDTGAKPNVGSPPDTGSRPDTGAKPGSPPDTGSRPDTGNKPDGGRPANAGSHPDAGSPPRAEGTTEKDHPQPPPRR